MNKDEILELLKNALKKAKGDQTEVVYWGGTSYLTRFANNNIHQNVGETDNNIAFRSIFGKKIGSASCNTLTKEALISTLKQAEEIAKLQEDDPNFVSLPSSEKIKNISAYNETTAKYSPEERATEVLKVLKEAKKNSLTASGAFTNGSYKFAVLNTLEVEAYFEKTLATFKTVIMSEDSSGYGYDSNVDIKKIDVEKVGYEAVSGALRGKSPVLMEPGEYEVILSPDALAELISVMAYSAFNARAVSDKVSFLSGKIGEKIAQDNITIYDDGLDPEGIQNPFDFEGVPKSKVFIFNKGIAEGVVYDSYYANKEGKKSTGHSLPQPSPYSPYPMNLFMDGSITSVNDMINDVKKGVYVTRFWYVNVVNPFEGILTGMTRDGTFLIEDGKLTKGLKNFRFTEKMLNMFNNVLDISKERKVIAEDFLTTVLPYLRVKKFRFSGVTEF